MNGARVHALRVASATWNKTEADLFYDVGIETLRLDARFRVLDESLNVTRIAQKTTQNDDVTEEIAKSGDEKKMAKEVRRGFANDSRGHRDIRDSRARVTAAAAAMARACGLAVDEAAGTAALRRSPFVDPRDAPSSADSASDGGVARDAFRPRRERFVDAKAPTAKGGFFRWRALIEGKAGR